MGDTVLRRVETARLVHEPGWLGKGPFILAIGRREYVVGQRKWSRDEVDDFWNAAARYPAWIATVEGRRYWLFRNRIFSENERLSQEEVYALLVSRDQQNQRKVDRAVASVRQGSSRIAPNRRQRIPDDVKQYVWQRDGGRCRNCWGDTELQFDHLIPVAMGGSSEPENLQLLCGPCNRMKGAGLTTRGYPSGPSWG